VIVRCGRCRSGFDVPGPGRYACPTCGTANQVGEAPSPTAPPNPPPAPPKPEVPSPRVTCTECGLSFIVGEVAVVPCPNCGSTVTVRPDEGEES
jgi:predicted RNA-binding Zn-ribbon protein involved in translation (DUF1610 family)